MSGKQSQNILGKKIQDYDLVNFGSSKLSSGLDTGNTRIRYFDGYDTALLSHYLVVTCCLPETIPINPLKCSSKPLVINREDTSCVEWTWYGGYGGFDAPTLSAAEHY